MLYQRSHARRMPHYHQRVDGTSTKRDKKNSNLIFLTTTVIITLFVLFLKDNAITRGLTVTLLGETPGFELCQRHSYGLFSDITNNKWGEMRQNVLQHRVEARKNPKLRFKPEFTCPHKLKIGSSKICEPDELYRQSDARMRLGGNGCLVYKIGYQDSWDFEEAVHDSIDESCEIHVFGFSRVPLAVHPLSMHYHNWVIQSSKSVPRANHKSFQESVTLLGHQGKTIDILKVDCEEQCQVNDWFDADVTILQISVQAYKDTRTPIINMDHLHHGGYVNFHIAHATSELRRKGMEMSLLKLSSDFFDENGRYDSDEIETQGLDLFQEEIPHIIFFTFKENILETRKPKLFYENVLNTIETYRKSWNEPEARVVFLDDDGCEKVIEQAHPDMVPYFQRERQGIYKADICRIAALYVHGGYYFDVDIEVIEPVVLSPTISFATAQSTPDSFFQAFMATTPKHPVLKKTLDLIYKVYQGKLKVRLLGTNTLQMAYDQVSEEERGEVLILHEQILNKNSYKDIPEREGHGCCCNWIVENPYRKVAHFYSRIVGYSIRCSLKPWGDSAGSSYEFR